MLNIIRAALRELLVPSFRREYFQLSEIDKVQFKVFLDHTNIRTEVNFFYFDLYDVYSADELNNRAFQAWNKARIDCAEYCYDDDTIYFDSGIRVTGEYERQMCNVLVVGRTVLNTELLRKYLKK